METNTWIILAYLFVGFIGLVLLFAQLKMFSIDLNLKKILEILEKMEADGKRTGRAEKEGN